LTSAGIESFPASFAQERLWFLDQLQPGLTAYNIARANRLRGPLDVPSLERALGALASRHEALRTTFASLEGAPVQLVAPSSRVALPVVAVSGRSTEDRERELSAVIAKEAALPYDLAHGPLWRARLYRLASDDHVLLLGMHHIVSDGWSLVVMFRELADLYAAYSAGRSAALPVLPIQYADYAEWQRAQLQGGQLESELSYWRRKLHGAARLELPTDQPRPPLQTFAGGKHSARITAAAAERLRELSRRQDASLFMTLLAAFKLLLSRQSGQRDIVVGTPIAARSRPELEGLIGFFVNTLVLRTDLSGDPTFVELLSRVRQTALEAYACQEFPFEKLVEELHPQRDQSRNPLFQVFVNMLSFGDDRKLELPSLAVERHDLVDSTAKFDLSLYLKEEAGTIGLTLVYNSDLFARERTCDLLEQYRSLLEQIADAPDGRLSRFDLVTAAAARVLPDARVLLAERPASAVHARVARPDGRAEPAPAVAHAADVVSYAELHGRSNRLANYLRAHGVQARDVVAIDGRRSAALVWSVLAVLKAGAAFTILDPAHPLERRLRMLRLARPKAWLELGEEPPERELERCLAELPLLCRRRVPARGEPLEDAPVREPRAAAADDAPAYVAFTSGSSGAPKGILGTHRPLAHFLEWHTRTFGLTAADRFSMLSGLSHDPLLRDVFAPLWLGATLCIPDARRMTDPTYLRDWLRRERISVAHLTPALAELLCQEEGPELTSLRYAFLGGDRLTRGTLERLQRVAPQAACVNFYGATETPQAIAFEIACADRSEVPIGRGIDGVQLLVLNDGGMLCGIGELGEIQVRTRYLSRGYLADDALTRERFVVNPFTDSDDDLVYRTGDLGRYLPDGKVEFCGRRDSQVKIQGFRVELEEVESALAAHPGIATAAVIAGDEAPGDRRLTAYLLASGPDAPGDRELRSFVGRSLPAYMVPRAFVWLEALPLTPNGKLDRRALPAAGRTQAALPEPPSTATEELLAGIWSQLLGVPHVGVHDSFFELGGHSLLATQVMSRIHSSLGLQLPLRSLFEAPTVSGLSARVDALRAEPGVVPPPIERAPRDASLALSFAQQRLWFLEQIEPAETARLVASAVELRGALDLDALRRAFDIVVARHETLRTTFGSEDGEPLQRVDPAAPVPLPLVDLRSQPESRARLARLLGEELQRPFDLSRGPLLRAIVYRLAEDVHVLLVAVHHIVSDGWSMGVLERELAACYGAFAEGLDPVLPALPVQYADFARWQRSWLSGEALVRQLGYWRERLSEAPRVLELPSDRPRPALESHRGARHAFALPAELSVRLAELSRVESVTLFMTLLAAFQVLLARYSGQQDVVVGSPIAGRNRAELEGLIGLFVNTLVLRADLSGDPSFREALGRVREAALGAYAHQDLPFEKLVEHLRPERDPSRNPLFQVMFALQNTPRDELSLAGLESRRVDMERRTSQFDLTLYMQESPEGLKGSFEYSTDLFEGSTVERMALHFAELLEAAAAHPDRRLSDLMPLAEREQQQLRTWNGTEMEYPKACVHELISRQASRTPAAIALECAGRAVSYEELEQRSERVSRRLARLGVGPEARVAILLERSPELAIAALGVLKAGGAYVPLDPAYPDERLAWMLQDSGAAAVLGGEQAARIAPPGVPVVSVEDAQREPLDGVRRACALPENLAYVIYTSGSTGRPKGVSVTHRAVVNLLASLGRQLGVNARDVWLSVTTFSFDIAGLELYLPLAAGGRVVLATRDEASDGVQLLARIVGCGATVMQATPWTWRLLLEAGWRGTAGLRVLCGGEELSRGLADQLLERAGEVWNLYGPTETTIWSSAWRIERDPGRVSIGRPIANTRMYVLDPGGRPLPVGVAGELHIAGDGLARGYWARPELTAEGFVPDPFGAPGGRLYRTGDRARWLRDGRLEYLGRADQQVKLRGFRIELAEIEAVLAGHPGVSAAAVLALEVRPGDTQLVAYVAHDRANEPNVTELRAYLKERLPQYMVPPAFVLLDELPLTANGKLDRMALAQSYDRGGKGWRAFVAPRTPTEAFIARLWQDVLGVEQVSVHDNFFDLGGHSLLAMRVLAAIERRVRRRINPREIIFQTLEQLAALCESPGSEPRARRPRDFAARLLEAIRGAVVKGRALVLP
jgi:surfactin family lipopeptide synthetase A